MRRLRKFARFLWHERRTSVIVFVCSLVLPLANIPLPFMFKNLVDSLAYSPQLSKILSSSIWLAVAYLIVKIGDGTREFLTQKYREKTTVRLKNLFFHHFMNIELGYYAKQGSGYFVARLNEVENLKDLLVDQIGGAISSLTLGVISFILLLRISPPCAFIFLVYIPIEIWGISIIRKKIISKSTNSQEARSRFAEQAQEYIQNVEKIKSSNLVNQIYVNFKQANEKVYHSIISLIKWRIGFDTALEGTSIPFFIVNFVILGSAIVRGERTVGDLIALNQLGTYFLNSFLQLATMLQQAFISLASFERVFDILEKEPEIKEGAIDASKLLNGSEKMQMTVNGI